MTSPERIHETIVFLDHASSGTIMSLPYADKFALIVEPKRWMPFWNSEFRMVLNDAFNCQKTGQSTTMITLSVRNGVI